MSSDLTLDFKLAFAFRWDSDARVHIGFCPTLGIYSQGRTDSEAEEALASAATLFIGECYDRDILHNVLRSRGMKRVAGALAGAEIDAKQFISVSGFERAIERSIPIHVLGPVMEDTACL